MIANRGDIARLHSDFYRDQFRRILRWLIYCIAIIYLLMGAIIYLVLFQKDRQFFANTTDGHILPIARIQYPEANSGGFKS